MKMKCVWLRSANPFDQLSAVCDLSRQRTLCGGDEEHCEFPALLEEENPSMGWIELVEEERYITGR